MASLPAGPTYELAGRVSTGPGDSTAFEVRFTVDSGVIYSVLPQPVWTQLGLAPQRRQDIRLPDGAAVTRSVSSCHISLGFVEGYAAVFLGEPGDVAVLGWVTLLALGFVLDPFTRQLQPAELRI
jgi:predicted aspartyl protease